MSCSSAIISTSSSTDVFDNGTSNTKLIKAEAQLCSRNNPPKPLLICCPSESGTFPVLIFLHGYLLHNSFYSQLIQHVASHGFIVVAPQLYSVAGADANNDIESTARVTDWLSRGLADFLPPKVKPDLTKLGLAGHSRGGKVAFALALSRTSVKFSALIGVDPVDGMDKGRQTPPPVLTYTPHSFNLDGMGVLVIGSGLAEVSKNPLFPPCAPKGVNHQDFYRECCKPSHYFVVKDYGHLDMLDDDTKGVRGKVTYCLCKNGESRKPMRKFVGGAIVAFLKAYLGGNFRDIEAVREGTALLPVELQLVQFQL